MAILNNSNAISSGGYDINNSLRFRSSASAYISRTPGSAGNRRTWTWSGWIKRGSITANSPLFTVSQDSANFTVVRFGPGTTDKLEVYTIRSSVDYSEETVALFRDPSAWYHVVFSVDTTQATAANRIRIYVNGVQQTTTQTYGQIPQNEDTFINTTNAHNICRNTDTTTQHFDGYLAEVNFIDGQALTPSSFGETDTTTGVWKPKAYTGTYGTNGFYLKFSDIATTSGSNAGLGKDFSGNTNYWTTNNISVTSGTTYDAMKDSPTNTSATVANYAVMNPVFGSTNVTLSEANLKAQVGSTGGVYRTAAATFGVSSGKWYWELVFGNPTTGNPLAGVGDMTVATSTWNSDTSTNANFWYVDASSGNKINGTGGPGSSYGSSFSTTDICMVALDMDNGKIWWGKNGTWFASGDPAAGTNAAYTNLANKLLTIALMGGCGSCGFSGNLYQLNFGQRSFSYTPPTGYVALNTYNLPTPTILQGNKYMDATLYTGNGSTQTITNAAGFKPDFVWVKTRSSGSYGHALFDSVRGTPRRLASNLTEAENTTGSFGQVSAFNSNGFTVATGSSDFGETGANTLTYVGWQWQAGQGSTSSNTSGSITSTVSVNTTAGFSIVTYTGNGAIGATVGHGLGVAPSMIILKRRTGATASWLVWHRSLSNLNNNYLLLDTTNAQLSSTNIWGTQTSSVIALDTDSLVNEQNANGSTFVAYCWAAIAGYSAFGSYTGNGSSDGPMVYCNFSPKFILIKRTDTSGTSWVMYDSARATYNVVDKLLLADSSGAEVTATSLDFLSNGFKLRSTDGSRNASGGTYIYAAFASNPFRNNNAY